MSTVTPTTSQATRGSPKPAVPMDSGLSGQRTLSCTAGHTNSCLTYAARFAPKVGLPRGPLIMGRELVPMRNGSAADSRLSCCPHSPEARSSRLRGTVSLFSADWAAGQ